MATNGEESSRPYRLYDAREKKNLRWRCYKHPAKALDGALREVHWAKVPSAIEVINKETWRVIGTYTQSVSGEIKFNHKRVNHG